MASFMDQDLLPRDILVCQAMGTTYSISYRSMFFFILSLDIALVLIYLGSHAVVTPGMKYSLNSKSIGTVVILNDQINITSLEKESICTTKWVNTSIIQFLAFSVDNFSEVNFIMPHEFSMVNESSLSCILRQHNGTQFITFVHIFGGKSSLDPCNRTLNLRCKIPEEISSNAHDRIQVILGE